MSILDSIFIIIMATFCLRGLVRGFVKEIASILGLILAFILANNFHELLVPSVQKSIETLTYARTTSYLIIFLAALIAVFILSTFFKQFLKMVMLDGLDRLGGAGLGFLKGLLLCSIILIVLTTFLSSKASILSNSKIAPYIGVVNDTLASLLPDEMQKEFHTKSSSLKEFWHAEWMEKLNETQEAAREIQEPTPSNSTSN